MGELCTCGDDCVACLRDLCWDASYESADVVSCVWPEVWRSGVHVCE